MLGPQQSFSGLTAFSDASPAMSLHVLGHSGLFDIDYYLGCNPDLLPLGSRALVHYHHKGWREGRKPNPCFDPAWYLAQNATIAGDPLLHYLEQGEEAGLRPVPWFDPLWYRSTYTVPEGQSPLAHYLLNRHHNNIRPIPEFDPVYYLNAYPDVAEAGIDPIDHYMIQGFREIRRPFAEFDPIFYRARYLNDDPNANPLLHYIANRDRDDVHPSFPLAQTSPYREATRFCTPGPHFEERNTQRIAAPLRARIFAYYLPQFHTIEQNDLWWGKGFTEWTNVARGMPRFAGHYQPRIPRDLGHYTLDNPALLRKQAEMARDAGIEGFVFYFYWFNRTRLLEHPLELLLADPSIELPFCLMWANENWTRSWDGSNDDVLIAQDYRAADEEALLDCLARYMKDARYICVDNRPVLMIYRPGSIPRAAATMARWRSGLQARLGRMPLIVMAQAFGDDDPRAFGLDGAIEFPPHKLAAALPEITLNQTILDPEFAGQIFDYEKTVINALAQDPPEYPLIRTACPSWDNDARRQGKGLILHGSTPALYEKWLGGLIAQARATPFHGEAIVCINAWNEWAEGAYLEPDQHFGSAYLNSTMRALRGTATTSAQGRILLIGHDAFNAGAQTLLLHLARSLRANHGCTPRILLLDGGDMLSHYRATCEVELLPGGDDARLARLHTLATEGFGSAIVNSVAAASLGPALAKCGISFTLLVHELPTLIRQRGLVEDLASAFRLAAMIIYPSHFVKNRTGDMIASDVTDTTGRVAILPQGLYTELEFSGHPREQIRTRIAARSDDKVIVAAGYGDIRKGFDLFLQLWRQEQQIRTGDTNASRTHFIWLGRIDPTVKAIFDADIAAAHDSQTFHLPGHVENIADYLCAADGFALVSREDPYPSVLLEALATGLPCVAFDDTGGGAELLRELSGRIPGAPSYTCVPRHDTIAMGRALITHAEPAHRITNAARRRIGRALAARFSFPDYVRQVMDVSTPAMRRISVVVLSYNYGRFLKARLASIFMQSHPVAEIIVLDDASGDDSVRIAKDTAREWGRTVRVVAARSNSGSVFAQWRRAATLATGDWLWIAEADDIAEPDFLSRLSRAMDHAPNAVMGFTDSRAIDEQDKVIFESYRPYCAQSAGNLLERDGVHDGSDFARRCLRERNLILNVSSVIFSTGALLQTLERLEPELGSYRIAGDWRVYLDLLQRETAQIVYVAEALNSHRRHPGSATGKLSPRAHSGEIARIHRINGHKPIRIARKAANS